MVKVIMGLKGSGKTKQLVELINNAVREENGSIVCMEKGNKLRFDIDYRVRLIESDSYGVDGYTFLKGFVSGLHAGNFDITNLFIDSLYKISGSSDLKETEEFLQWCEKFSEANGVNITITISDDIANATESMKKYFLISKAQGEPEGSPCVFLPKYRPEPRLENTQEAAYGCNARRNFKAQDLCDYLAPGRW